VKPLLKIVLTTVAFAALIPLAHAHHFKGLPHFSYFENYPQVPTEEFIGQNGAYEFSLVLYDFQGIKREEAEQPDDARFYMIVFNLRENRTYNGPLTMEIMDRGTSVYSERKESSHEESLYSMQKVLPESGKYALRVTLHDEKDLATDIPFYLSAQKIHWGKWLAGSLFMLISIVAVGSRKARLIQDRKENAQGKRVTKPIPAQGS
jgi:hypothetical protein